MFKYFYTFLSIKLIIHLFYSIELLKNVLKYNFDTCIYPWQTVDTHVFNFTWIYSRLKKKIQNLEDFKNRCDDLKESSTKFYEERNRFEKEVSVLM